MSDIQNRVLHAMRPGCFYRNSDIARELGVKYGQTRYALGRLVRGGVVVSEEQRGTRRKLYTKKQMELVNTREQLRYASSRRSGGDEHIR